MSVSTELRRLRAGRATTRPTSDRSAYGFLSPWLIGLVVITAGPIVASLVLSFTDYNLLQDPSWIGLDNFRRMLSDDRLRQSLWVTFVYVVLGVPLQLGLALAIAVLLNRGMRGLALYRSVLYLPSLLGGSVAVAILWRQIFGTEGLINQVLGFVGIEGIGWISDPRTALYSIIALHVWTFGAPMVIFLAGLRQIPASYYEAAVVDGAGRWQVFRHITLPLITPIIFFNLVLQIISAFQAFTQAFIVSGGTGGPSDSTLFFTLYLYEKGFGELDMGYAAALAWLLLLIIGVFTAINFYAARFWVFYDD
ncbi:sugar ABC transporter permease [Jiangella aurantiaca]|uniref:Sugar ABC transporter permease n=1 Tax=Jiangella aurantiaca TaxID=2530373 RepID=A0A4R5A615_9ACTN|nr:sugar ABC transporter permease [Jiangella aurantiaca]TDD67488.1 sugar ABC transporter permease [Jiangella aurantiaca]